MNREPLVNTGIVTAIVTATLALLVSFGLHVSDDQQSAILGFVAVVAPLVAVLAARGKVTPLSDPQDQAGRPLYAAASELPDSDDPVS